MSFTSHDLHEQAKASNPATQPVESVVFEAGHGYIDLIDDPETDIPAPNPETIAVVQNTCDDYGVNYQLLHIADDTSKDLGPGQLDNKQDIVNQYLNKWDFQPDSISFESEAADVWKDAWSEYQNLEGATGGSKLVPFSCAALDAAMIAEKLGETDQTSIPSADLAVTQHDENLPVPSQGGYSSFHGYQGQDDSHQIQQDLYNEGATDVPLWQLNLEYNPEEVAVQELEESLEEVFI